MQGDESNAGADGTLGRIALKQVRVTRAEVEARNRESNAARKSTNPMNRLVPYLDLFWRLGDEELSRLARAPSSAVETLRLQVDEVNRALGRYIDLLPRLSDDELARLTGASVKTIRFWRLSQPRHLQGDGRRQTSPASSSEPADPALGRALPGAAGRRTEPSSAQSSGSMRRNADEHSDFSEDSAADSATDLVADLSTNLSSSLSATSVVDPAE